MKTINKRFSRLILITICLLFLLSSGSIYTIYLTYTIKSDAKVINKLGVIRGSIQRLIKLELGGMENEKIIKAIDINIAEFNDKKIRVHDHNKEIQNSLDNLYLSWTKLKEIIDVYIKNPSIENQQALVKKSEELWTKSNDMVFTSQLVAERKVERYKTSFIIFLMNFMLGAFIIYLIKRYVKDILEYQVNYDSLTKIYNRRYFCEYLDNEIL